MRPYPALDSFVYGHKFNSQFRLSAPRSFMQAIHPTAVSELSVLKYGFMRPYPTLDSELSVLKYGFMRPYPTLDSFVYGHKFNSQFRLSAPRSFMQAIHPTAVSVWACVAKSSKAAMSI